MMSAPELVCEVRGKKKYGLAIQSVFLARENILFIKEWVVYHMELGVDHFYLYDNTGSKGRHGSNKKVNKYGIPFAKITEGMSDEYIQNIMLELQKEFPGKITYVRWTPKNDKGEIVYDWENAFGDFVEKYGMEAEWTAFIDMDEFLFSAKVRNLKDILNEYEKMGFGYLQIKDKKFEDRFQNLDKHVTEIDRCIDGFELNDFPKNIIQTDMIDMTALNDTSRKWVRPQHNFPFMKGESVWMDKDILRLNHYHINKKNLKFLKGFYHILGNFYLNSQDDSMKRYWNIIESKCGNNRPIDILDRYPSTSVKGKHEEFVMSPKISIIVPVYNVEEYIEACLDSLVNQTVKDIEVIIVNDGTKDKSAEIAETYVQKYSNFSIYHKSNSGLGDARNYGMKYVKGEYIMFLDSDDMLTPTACEQLFKAAVETGSDITIGKSLWEKGNRCEPVKYLKHWFKGDLDRNYRHNSKIALGYPVATGKLIRTSLLFDNNIRFPNIIGEDVPFAVETFYYSRNIRLIGEVVYLRTKRVGTSNKSITQTCDYKTIRDRLTGWSMVYEFCSKHSLSEIIVYNDRNIKNIIRILLNIMDINEKIKGFDLLKEELGKVKDKNRRKTISKALKFEYEKFLGMKSEDYLNLRR